MVWICVCDEAVIANAKCRDRKSLMWEVAHALRSDVRLAGEVVYEMQIFTPYVDGDEQYTQASVVQVDNVCCNTIYRQRSNRDAQQ